MTAMTKQEDILFSWLLAFSQECLGEVNLKAMQQHAWQGALLIIADDIALLPVTAYQMPCKDNRQTSLAPV